MLLWRWTLVVFLLAGLLGGCSNSSTLADASIADTAPPSESDSEDSDEVSSPPQDVVSDTTTADSHDAPDISSDTSADMTQPSVIGACDADRDTRAQMMALEAAFDEITSGVSVSPVTRALEEDTNGRLQLGFGGVFPILNDNNGVYAAASTLGQGRVVAFSGQDFLSSGTRSTLLDDAGVRQLVQQATVWASGQDDAASIRAAVGSDVVAVALSEVGVPGAVVAPVIRREGLHEIRDWSAQALTGKHVAVVQINEWGTLHLGDEHVEALRQFVRDGGGLVIAGSALHWSWWLAESAPFPGDALLAEAGITWDRTTLRDMRAANMIFDAASVTDELWCRYVLGDVLSNSALTRLGSLFEAARRAGRSDELDAALARLVRETPPLPVARTHARAQLAASVAADLGPHRWPAAHPWTAVFPGATTSAPQDLSASINTAFKRAQPLGAYAPAGVVVTVHVPASVVGAGLTLRVGDLFDDNRNLENIDPWERPPLLVREFPVDSETLEVTNAFGGSLYLVVPDDFGDQQVTLTLNGAVAQAVYTRRDGVGAWSVDPASTGAPLAIVQEPAKIRMVVATSAAAQVPDLNMTLAFWAEFYDHHVALSQEPAPRNYASHWLFDPQVGYGYANATPARIAFPKLSEVWALRSQVGDEDWWLFGHELGHQFQTSDWRGGDITEVAVNLWTMYTLNTYIHGGGNFETRGHRDNRIDHAALRDARWASADLFGKLELYRQLVFEFGWDAFKQTFATYYDPAFPRTEYGEFMDGFAHRFSAVVGRDITPFLLHWEYPISPEAVSAITGRGYPPWLPPGW